MANNIDSTSSINEKMQSFYLIHDSVIENWYKQLPYCFRHTDRKGIIEEFYLPLSPSNISIVTHFATNVISTMYGTVEEHSEQRYYDITIAGTTGMSPRYYDVKSKNLLRSDPASDAKTGKAHGRSGFQVKSLLNTHGFAQRSMELIQNTLNSATDLLGGANKGKTGIDLKKTGYIAFHNLYRFLLAYKKDASGQNGTGFRYNGHPLQFVNYKDNNEYDVSIQGFQLTRDASDPMLYNYNISLRAYNLRNADGDKQSLDIEARANDLGLSGLEPSIFATMSNKARQAKNAVYSAVAAAKGIGS